MSGAPAPPSDTEAVWSHMRRLLGRLVQAVDRGSFLDDCLDTLVDLLGADRGLVLLVGEDGGAVAVNARGQGRALDPYEREEISKTIVRRVQDAGECVIWRPFEDAAPTESMHVLGIASALAAPLRSMAWDGDPRAPLRGVLYLDFRSRRRQPGEAQRELVEAAAHVMAAVLGPYEKLQVAQGDLRALSALRDGPAPTLDELLRPESMAHLRAEVASCLHGESSILVLGESGTGKTELARAIAEASGRAPVVRAVLGSSDDLNTITSELFGHEKGAYSGAFSKRTGVVEFADGGTLILDEILNLPPHAQQLLLDFTQFGTYRPLGYEKREPKRARVRLIAATNGDLDAAMREGRFRQDLYYRIAAVTLPIPPLRERRGDIPALAEGVLRRIDRARAWQISVPLRRLLMSSDLPWSGNVRQLEAVIGRARERALLRDPEGRTLTPEHLMPRDLGCATLAAPAAGPPADLDDLGDSFARLTREREALDAQEKRIIEAALDREGGVAAAAARALGVPRTSLISRIDTLGIEARSRARGKRRGS